MTKKTMGKAVETVSVEVKPAPVVSRGQEVVAKVAEWIAGYMSFRDPFAATLIALYAIGTWKFYRLDVYPYLVITKGSPGCGATRLMELLSMLCLDPILANGTSGVALLRLMAAKAEEINEKGQSILDPSVAPCTIMLDEAEITNTERKSNESSFWNAGYRMGQTTGKVIGKETVQLPNYAPRILALIGATAATMVDRSIVQVLHKANDERELARRKQFRFAQARREAMILVEEIKAMWTATDESELDLDYPEHLKDRDQEIWSAIFGLANGLHLDSKIKAELVRYSTDNVTWKKNRANFEALRPAGDEATKNTIARLIADFATVIKADEKFVATGELINRLQAIPTAPWRTYNGNGLNPELLRGLTAKCGVTPKQVKSKALGPNPVRGYDASSLRNAKLLVKSDAQTIE